MSQDGLRLNLRGKRREQRQGGQWAGKDEVEEQFRRNSKNNRIVYRFVQEEVEQHGTEYIAPSSHGANIVLEEGQATHSTGRIQRSKAQK